VYFYYVYDASLAHAILPLFVYYLQPTGVADYCNGNILFAGQKQLNQTTHRGGYDLYAIHDIRNYSKTSLLGIASPNISAILELNILSGAMS
jgi:hypothetical protein